MWANDCDKMQLKAFISDSSKPTCACESYYKSTRVEDNHSLRPLLPFLHKSVVTLQLIQKSMLLRSLLFLCHYAASAQYTHALACFRVVSQACSRLWEASRRALGVKHVKVEEIPPSRLVGVSVNEGKEGR